MLAEDKFAVQIERAFKIEELKDDLSHYKKL
jgi:hypothetical protein